MLVSAPWAAGTALVNAVAGGSAVVDALGRVAMALAPLEALVLVPGPVKQLPPAPSRIGLKFSENHSKSIF